jgi:formylglycine-generating enzyme required for sulfatase activity
MGSDRHYPEEAPEHDVYVDGFWMDSTTVTNAQFKRFVEATGYVTLAERPLDPTLYPDAHPELLVPGSAVFRMPEGPTDLRDCFAWWSYVPGADWRHPEGPDSSIFDRSNHPVVHIAYEDAEAYARWAGKDLPTEAEWERAARGGPEGAEYCWGEQLAPEGRLLANFWQGQFPWENLLLDGFERTAPVASFPPNGYGLFDMTGNVWEWTTDYFAARHLLVAENPCSVTTNPRGPEVAQNHEGAFGDFPRKVIKGGSFLCAANYCYRYRPAARFPQTVDTSTCHVGFRCVLRSDSRARAA